ncbi:MAG: PAS domain S-box protein, partial [Nitrospirae bacterium]|nr:PAS domain S-box protein [Nitrospirota bacterium]
MKEGNKTKKQLINELIELRKLIAESQTSITERKQAEEALKEAMAFNESTLNAIDDIFYTFDLSGKMLIWNKAGSRVTGYSDTELSSKKPTDLFLGEDVQRISESIERMWKEGSSKAEAKLVLKDGRQVPYEFTGSILKDSKGNIIGFSGIGRDLTERKQTEKEREKLIAELQEALAKVKTLSRLLPICASCKKIRDDKGYWSEIEEYITEHT